MAEQKTYTLTISFDRADGEAVVGCNDYTEILKTMLKRIGEIQPVKHGAILGQIVGDVVVS